MVTDSTDYFNKQNTIGEFGEEVIFRPYFEGLGFEVIHVDDVNKADRPFYDFKCIRGDEEILVEVKTDVAALKYRNLFVEYEQNRRPSGISTTKSDFWAHIIGDFIYLMDTKVLKDYCKGYKTLSVKNEEGYWVKGYIVPECDISQEKVYFEKFKIDEHVTDDLIKLWEKLNKKKLFSKRG